MPQSLDTMLQEFDQEARAHIAARTRELVALESEARDARLPPSETDGDPHPPGDDADA